MSKTAMWNEVHDQVEVCETILAQYLPKAADFSEKLQGKKKILLTGTGASLYACQMAKYLFFRYSGRIPTVLPADEMHYVLDQIDQDTLTIFVSQSGESYETKLVSGILKERGIEFWGITNDGQSHLAQNAAEVFLLHCGKEVSSATKTNTATFLLLAIIAAGHNPEVASQLRRLPEQIKGALDCQAQIEQWAEALCGEMQMYLLGTGVNGATAVEGALMMKEKTFIHTAGSSVSDFRHGTVEVIEKGLPVILVGAGEEMNRQLDLHASYLASLGVEVRIVTDQPERFTRFPGRVIPVPAAGIEELSPMLTVIPLQLLAEAVARKKGLDVDGFRHLSKIVAEYHTEEASR